MEGKTDEPIYISEVIHKSMVCTGLSEERGTAKANEVRLVESKFPIIRPFKLQTKGLKI